LMVEVEEERACLRAWRKQFILSFLPQTLDRDRALSLGEEGFLPAADPGWNLLPEPEGSTVLSLYSSALSSSRRLSKPGSSSRSLHKPGAHRGHAPGRREGFREAAGGGRRQVGRTGPAPSAGPTSSLSTGSGSAAPRLRLLLGEAAAAAAAAGAAMEAGAGAGAGAAGWSCPGPGQSRPSLSSPRPPSSPQLPSLQTPGAPRSKSAPSIPASTRARSPSFGLGLPLPGHSPCHQSSSIVLPARGGSRACAPPAPKPPERRAGWDGRGLVRDAGGGERP
jgi:hypothetical protein